MCIRDRDMQEDKEPAFDAIDTANGCLKLFEGMLGTMRFNRDVMARSAMNGFTNATDADVYKRQVLDVPNSAPMEVAVASANKALSSLDLKPEFLSMRRSSSALKIPLRRPVPMKVPIVSKVSEMLNAKIVISTRGSFAGSENRLVMPPSLKIARKVEMCIRDSGWSTFRCGARSFTGLPP